MTPVQWACAILVGIVLVLIATVVVFLSIDEAQRRIDARQD